MFHPNLSACVLRLAWESQGTNSLHTRSAPCSHRLQRPSAVDRDPCFLLVTNRQSPQVPFVVNVTWMNVSQFLCGGVCTPKNTSLLFRGILQFFPTNGMPRDNPSCASIVLRSSRVAARRRWWCPDMWKSLREEAPTFCVFCLPLHALASGFGSVLVDKAAQICQDSWLLSQLQSGPTNAVGAGLGMAFTSLWGGVSMETPLLLSGPGGSSRSISLRNPSQQVCTRNRQEELDGIPGPNYLPVDGRTRSCCRSRFALTVLVVAPNMPVHEMLTASSPLTQRLQETSSVVSSFLLPATVGGLFVSVVCDVF